MPNTDTAEIIRTTNIFAHTPASAEIQASPRKGSLFTQRVFTGEMSGETFPDPASLDFKPLPRKQRPSTADAPVAMALWKSNKGKDHPTLIIRLNEEILHRIGSAAKQHLLVRAAWSHTNRQVVFRLTPCELGEGTRIRPMNRFAPSGTLQFPRLGEGLLHQTMREVKFRTQTRDDSQIELFVTAPIEWAGSLKTTLDL
jgi:hypothetical protein